MDTELSPVAIADDGELQDVRRLLDELDIRFVDAWQGDASSDSLWISNPRHALERGAPQAAHLGPVHPAELIPRQV